MTKPGNRRAPDGFTFREPRPSDLDELWRLDQLCFEPRIAYSRGQLRAYLRPRSARTVVAEESGGGIAGFAIASAARGGAVHVITLDVHPDFRRRGLGRELLERAVGGVAPGGETLLEVDAGNRSAAAFYEALGFKVVRRLPDYYAPGRHALQMSRRR